MKVAFALLCAFAVVLVGCQTTPVVPGATVTEEGAFVFSATGTSVIDQADSPLSKIKAYAAAETTAKANLLELIKGARVTGDTRVADLMFVSQEAEREVVGWLARTIVTFEEGPGRVEPDTITATAALTLDSVSLANLAAYAE